jgi:hypothetical protein
LFASLLVQASMLQKAVEILEDVIAGETVRYGEASEEVASTSKLLGTIHLSMGDQESALSCFNESLEMYRTLEEKSEVSRRNREQNIVLLVKQTVQIRSQMKPSSRRKTSLGKKHIRVQFDEPDSHQTRTEDASQKDKADHQDAPTKRRSYSMPPRRPSGALGSSSKHAEGTCDDDDDDDDDVQESIDPPPPGVGTRCDAKPSSPSSSPSPAERKDETIPEADPNVDDVFVEDGEEERDTVDEIERSVEVENERAISPLPQAYCDAVLSDEDDEVAQVMMGARHSPRTEDEEIDGIVENREEEEEFDEFGDDYVDEVDDEVTHFSKETPRDVVKPTEEEETKKREDVVVTPDCAPAHDDDSNEDDEPQTEDLQKVVVPAPSFTVTASEDEIQSDQPGQDEKVEERDDESDGNDDDRVDDVTPSPLSSDAGEVCTAVDQKKEESEEESKEEEEEEKAASSQVPKRDDEKIVVEQKDDEIEGYESETISDHHSPTGSDDGNIFGGKKDGDGDAVTHVAAPGVTACDEKQSMNGTKEGDRDDNDDMSNPPPASDGKDVVAKEQEVKEEEMGKERDDDVVEEKCLR